MVQLIAAALALFASHALLSTPPIRPWLIDRLGRRGFQTLHGTISAVTLAAFILAYAGFEASWLLYTPLPGAGHGAVALMPAAFLLVAARLLTRFGELAAPPPPRAIYRITRHPGSIGLLLWAGLHLTATGDLKRVTLFSAMAAIALFAIVKNDLVLRRAAGDEARRFREATSVVPFAAIFGGRQRLDLAEIGWRAPLFALIAYAVMLRAHPTLFGVDPFDWVGYE